MFPDDDISVEARLGQRIKMFALKSLSKKLFGTDTKLEICSITAGQLYLVRPGGIKGFTECIFKDAQATIRRTYVLLTKRINTDAQEYTLSLPARD